MVVCSHIDGCLGPCAMLAIVCEHISSVMVLCGVLSPHALHDHAGQIESVSQEHGPSQGHSKCRRTLHEHISNSSRRCNYYRRSAASYFYS